MSESAPLLAARQAGWGAILAWAAVAGLTLAFGGFFRLTVDALTCGDDGPFDNYSNAGARSYCDFLHDVGAFSVSSEATLHPASYWWFVVALPVALLVGALTLRRPARLLRSVALAVTVLVLLPAILGSPAFAVFYVLPVAVAPATSLVGLARDATELPWPAWAQELQFRLCSPHRASSSASNS
jgi:hypothetical protein